MKTAVVMCLCILWISNAACSSIKCRENIFDIKNICTIDSYTSKVITEDGFELDPIYRDEPITDLIFINSKLPQIPNEIFTNLGDLQLLDLSYCQVANISSTTFIFSKNLRALFLQFNRLTKLIDSVFEGAYNLERINLSHNRIRTVGAYVFTSFKRLKFLDLSYNLIKIESSIVFPAFLSQLNLSFNQISNFSISDLNVIENLTINNNNLIYLKLNAQAKCLQADNNMLTSQNINFRNGNLISLSLANNSVSNFNVINHMSNLSYLDLSFNAQKVGIEFQNLKNLKILILKSTNLKQSDIESFSKLSSLETLDLSSNNLPYIEFNSLSQLANLKYLNLTTNNLNSRTFSKFDYLFENLAAVDITENNWICTDLIAVLTQLKRLRIDVDITHANIIEKNIRGIRCTGGTQTALNNNQETNTSDSSRSKNSSSSSNTELNQILNDLQNNNMRLKTVLTDVSDKLYAIESNDDANQFKVIYNKLITEINVSNINAERDGDTVMADKLDNLEKAIINKINSNFVELYDVKVYLMAAVQLVTLLFMAGVVFVTYKKCCGQSTRYRNYQFSSSTNEQEKSLYP